MLLGIIGTLAYFSQPQGPIIDPTNYEVYLTDEHLHKKRDKLSEEITFWKDKLVSAPGNHVFEKKLAGLLTSRFKLSGDPTDLHQADSLLQSVNERIPGQVGVLQSLTSNAITQHRFRDAEQYIAEAYEIGEKRFVSSMLYVDVLLERGQLYSAKKLMQQIISDSHFDYLVRDVKFQDELGDLTTAIEQMERSLTKAKSAGNEAIINWSLSNLADMYGHDGRIQKSYSTYLKALSYNPADLHSLKGIAWVAFSHDKNTAEAKRILRFLKSVHPVPDYDLFLAEIAVFENDQPLADKLENGFIADASQPIYGNMYKSYLCELTSSTSGALNIARAEVKERPHPTSYDLLAWASFQNGDIKEAVRITENNVMLQTGEPVALYHSGIILKEAGRYEKAENYLKEALNAAYELGPVVAKEIQLHLEELDQRSLTTSKISDVFDLRSFR